MIFPILKCENIVQVNDKTRLDATKSFQSPYEAAVTLFEIEPESGAGFFAVGTSKYLDWAYSSAGEKTATVRITTDGSPVTSTQTLTIISEADDKLFSNDQDLITMEDDILRLLRPGRASFLDKHRMAQFKIIDALDQMGLTDGFGNKLTKLDLFDATEVNEWSKYLTLNLIFASATSEANDVYMTKAAEYLKMAQLASKRAGIRFDTDQDGSEDMRPDLYSARLVRR